MYVKVTSGLRNNEFGELVILFKSFLTIQELHLCLRNIHVMTVFCQPNQLPHRSRVSGSAALWFLYKNLWFLTPPIFFFLFICVLQKWFNTRYAQWRKAEGLPAQLGSVLDWDSKKKQTKNLLDCLKLWPDLVSPGQTDPTTSSSYTSPLSMCHSLFLYLWSYFKTYCVECEGVCVLLPI